MKFYKSLKFKLTAWYSALLFILSVTLLVSINIIMNSYYSREPHRFSQLQQIPDFAKDWITLDLKRKKMIEDIRQNDLHNIRKTSLFMVIPLLITSFGGGLLIAEQMLKPVNKLISATQKLTSQNLGDIFQIETEDDELGVLTNNFNAMSQRLKQSFDAQKEFTANASHELKTPLTIIQSALDSALEDKKITQTELVDLIKKASNSTKDMTKLINNLLLLATPENEVEMVDTNLVKILKDSISNVKMIFPNREIVLQTVHKYIVINGNSTLLTRAITNIIENAVKYSPEDKPIKVICKHKDNTSRVSIVDKGIGIKKDKINKLTKRFYRADESRSKKTGGYGLGLSIAKKIIDLHHAKLKISSTYKNGTSVLITLHTIQKKDMR